MVPYSLMVHWVGVELEDPWLYLTPYFSKADIYACSHDLFYQPLYCVVFFFR